MREAWRDVPGYEGLYQVSNKGKVYSVRSGTILQPARSGSGYRKINLCRSGASKQCHIHRLVAVAFLPNPENKPHVNHLNGDKTDNRADNLEWVTRSENQLHCRRELKTWCGAPKKPVICVETGEIYASAGAAAEHIGMSRSSVNLAVLGYNKTAKNLHFKFLEE